MLLCRTRHVPAPTQVAEALCNAGYPAFVEVENGPTTSPSAELRYAPGRMPIVICYNNDLHDNFDEGNYEYWEWTKELVPDATLREGTRRFIFVSSLENVDTKALQIVIDYLRDRTNSTVITQEQLDKQ